MAVVKIQLKVSDLKDRKPVRVVVEGKNVFLVLIDGQCYAMDAVCSHRGGPLEQGLLTDYNIKCPWHGATYDVRTGKVDPKTPWGKGQAHYDAKVDPKTGEITISI